MLLNRTSSTQIQCMFLAQLIASNPTIESSPHRSTATKSRTPSRRSRNHHYKPLQATSKQPVNKEREKKIGNWHRYWKSYPRQQTLVYYNATIKMICSLLFYFILILNVSSLLNFNLCSCFTLFTGCLLVACSGL